MIPKNRRYILPIFTLIVVLLINLACKSQKIPGNWTDSEIVVDGKIDDWSKIPVMFFEEQGAALSFCNDSSSLYIQFRTSDSKWIRTIKMSGITLYFDTSGKENKDFYVRYKGGPSMKDLMDKGGQMKKDSPSEMNPMGGDTATQLTCYIKNRIIEKPIRSDGSEGPEVAYDTSYGFYCYEFRIPLQASTIRYYGLDTSPGNPISIGAVWGDMGEMKQTRPDMGGGSGGGMGGGPPGGGMGGGPPGGGMGGKKPDMPSKQEVWLKSQLMIPVTEEC